MESKAIEPESVLFWSEHDKNNYKILDESDDRLNRDKQTMEKLEKNMRHTMLARNWFKCPPEQVAFPCISILKPAQRPHALKYSYLIRSQTKNKNSN